MNILTKAEKEGAVCEYKYDGLGNRIRSTVTQNGVITEDISYTTDQMTPFGDIIATYDNVTGSTSVFTYGEGLISVRKKDKGIFTDTLSYYKMNVLGSVTGLYDKHGRLVTEIGYDEYGIIRNKDAVAVGGNIFSYTGYVYEDNTELYYAKARYYKPEAGRFVSMDIYRGSIRNSISRNRYAYVLNNPINLVDPSGRNAISAILAIPEAAAALIVVALIAGGMAAYEVGNYLYTNNIFLGDMLINALKNLKYLSPSTINEIIRGYEESKRIQEEALHQTWLSIYPDGKFPAPNPTPAPPSFKAQPAQPSVEILIPPKVAGYEDIEIFPEITKDPSGNIIIDFPVELGSFGGRILWTPPSEFKNRFYYVVGFPAVQRDMKDYILYSGSNSKTSKLIIDDAQFGKKVGKHAQDYGLDPSNPASRIIIRNKINNIFDNPTEIRHGYWRGLGEKLPNGSNASGSAKFYIQGNDVVVTDMKNNFVTILKDGITNPTVNKATSIWS